MRPSKIQPRLICLTAEHEDGECTEEYSYPVLMYRLLVLLYLSIGSCVLNHQCLLVRYCFMSTTGGGILCTYPTLLNTHGKHKKPFCFRQKFLQPFLYIDYFKLLYISYLRKWNYKNLVPSKILNSF